MGDNNTLDPTMASEDIPRRRRGRKLLLAGATGAGLTLLLVFLFRDSLPWLGTDDAGNRFPPGVLADYVPEDSEALVVVNVRSLRESPIGRQHLGPSLQQIVRQAERRVRWMDLLGINLLEDVDTIQISFAPGAGDQPVWLMGGRLDRSRFQIGRDKLSETTLDRFRVWEYTDRATKRTTLLAPVGDVLVVSETRSRVLAALKQANDPRPTSVRDAKLRDLLAKMDRRQSIWLAASIESLGPISGIDNYLLKIVLHPLLAHADSVYGGIACAEDLRIEMYFHAATDEDAVRLETALQNIHDTAPGAALLLERQKELLPLLHMLGASTIGRDGKTIRLRCRLTADQLEG